MKKASLALAMLVAMLMAVGLPGTALAKSSPTLTAAPTDVSCDFNDDPSVTWVASTDGESKWSLELIAGYNTDGVPGVDVTLTFSFGTGKSGVPALNILFSSLTHDFGAGPILPVEVDAQVKGLTQGKSQNNPFSDLVGCTLPD